MNTDTGHSIRFTDADPAIQQFFIEQLKDIYWAEKYLARSLPRFERFASAPELKQAITMHTAQTQEQVERIEEIFELLERKAQGKTCEGMEGLVEEADMVVDETDENSATRDVGIIFSLQKVEHYEIATYGSLAQLARTLGRDDIAAVLATSLNEEKETDELLTTIAESKINYQATQQEEQAG